jgi:ComF family protein
MPAADRPDTTAHTLAQRAHTLAQRARGLGAMLLPAACPLCEMPAPAGRALLCRWCVAALPGIDARRCPRCALALGASGTCRVCRDHPAPTDDAIALADYAAPLDGLVRALKYRDRTALAAPLAAALAARVAACQPAPCWPELVVPVPLSEARLRGRGYNQSLLIARGLARRLDLSLAADTLVRTGGDAEMHLAGRPRAGRERALAGAFTASTRLRGRRVVLVDDVMTTGATLRAAARAIRAAGAAAVSAWVVARTP